MGRFGRKGRKRDLAIEGIPGKATIVAGAHAPR
jgi:hypothetical protein